MALPECGWVVGMQQVYEASQRPGTASKTWWTLPLPQAPHTDAQLSPIVERSLAVLIKLLHLTDTIAYKCMTLTTVTLWYAYLFGNSLCVTETFSMQLENHCYCLMGQSRLPGCLVQTCWGFSANPASAAAAAHQRHDAHICMQAACCPVCPKCVSA